MWLNYILINYRNIQIEMANYTQANFEKLFQLAVPLFCPTEDQEGNLYTVSTNGDVY